MHIRDSTGRRGGVLKPGRRGSNVETVPGRYLKNGNAAI